MILETSPAPFGPWTGLGFAALLLVCGLLLIWRLVRIRDKAHAAVSHAGFRTPWWRLRLAGYNWAPLAAGAVLFLAWSVSMTCYALYLWTGIDVFGVLCVVLGLGATAYYLIELAIALLTDKYDPI